MSTFTTDRVTERVTARVTENFTAKFTARFAPRVIGSLATALVVLGGPARSFAQGAEEEEDVEWTGEDCPEPLRGSTMSAIEVRAGVALEFATATPTQVELLRLHLRGLAERFAEGSAPQGDAAPMAAPGEPQMPVLETEVEDTAQGAQLILRTPRAEDVIQLRALGRELEETWPHSPCSPAMSMPASGLDAGPSLGARG